MSYTKNTWANGNVITAAKLNHMEDGIEGASGGGSSFLIVHEEDSTLDKTWQEIWDAAEAETPIFIYFTEDGEVISFWPVTEVSTGGGDYGVLTTNGVYIAQTADDYPIAD